MPGLGDDVRQAVACQVIGFRLVGRDAFLDQEAELRVAYQLKEAFRDLYGLPGREEAEHQLKAWCDQALTSGLPEMAQVVETLHDWWTEILN